ncbi:hypothetical protein [Reyranella sp.]|jgi:hypothetical protein|uniref:hypothetical protein n=1 Tax=Reyranella sp. TaxID=1929291 RepID=UPI002F94CE2D
MSSGAIATKEACRGAPAAASSRMQDSWFCEEETPRAGELLLEIALMLAAHMTVVTIIAFVLDRWGIR